MPVFRTRADAELTRKIYQRVPVLVNERTGENPWGVSFLRMFDMSNDSGLFVTEPREGFERLYEAKMVWHFNHRWATFSNADIVDVPVSDLINPNFSVVPRYWVNSNEIYEKIKNRWKNKWFLGYRRITNAGNERTMVSSIVPEAGITDVLPVQFISEVHLCSLLLANYNSLCFDYISRQKIGGLHIDFHQLRQFPVISPNFYTGLDFEFISSRVLELVYTAYDLRPYAEDMGYFGNPFPWDEERRAVLRAELDAYYARLYGLNRKQLRYILDPADLTPRELENILDPWEEVADPLDSAGYDARRAASDFPGETFRVLKDKEIRQYGEYRTRRLILEAWDRLEDVEVGNPDGNPSQRAAVSQKQETILVPQPKSESRPAVVQTQLPAPAKPNSPVKPPAKVVKAIDPPADQPTLTDFGLYKCEVCGKMVMGFEKANHEREIHGGKGVEWKMVR